MDTRLAPSPTGEMHAGTIFAALQAWLIARSTGGRVVLRIEDLDRDRSKAEYSDGIMRDLEELGIDWDDGPFYQSDREGLYRDAFDELARAGAVYECFCSRADLRSMSAPHEGEERVYDGRCHSLSDDDAALRREELLGAGRRPAIRVEVPARTVSFADLYQGERRYRLKDDCGDFVVRRADGGFAYQLAVVVDDHDNGIDCVSRGWDLLASTPKQMLLYDALGFDIPAFAHFPLLCAPDGRRLSKRDHDASYGSLKASLGSAEAVLGHVAYMGRLIDEDVPSRPEDVLASFSVDRMRKRYEGTKSLAFSA